MVCWISIYGLGDVGTQNLAQLGYESWEIGVVSLGIYLWLGSCWDINLGLVGICGLSGNVCFYWFSWEIAFFHLEYNFVPVGKYVLVQLGYRRCLSWDTCLDSVGIYALVQLGYMP